MKLLHFDEYSVIAQLMWDRGLVPAAHKYLELEGELEEEEEEGGQRGGAEHLRKGGGGSVNGTNGAHTRALHYRAAPALARVSARTSASASASARRLGVRNVYGSPHPTPARDVRYSLQVPFNGTVFLTTEDPEVIEQANSWGAAHRWSVVYTQLFDRAQMTARKTWDEQQKKGSVAVHNELEYISMLLNLYYALRCEAWVCTLASNSCRIMDELRATVGGKANRYYTDLSVGSCAHPPCLDGNDGGRDFGE
ncbi:hypothetical protein B484DRAFT_146928 [Ochromonadaceae sp. CCMP2298]|nr:hypothetical protein B484DRAFT_146928 [Ochromonadaceae sp. CCMP2298]